MLWIIIKVKRTMKIEGLEIKDSGDKNIISIDPNAFFKRSRIIVNGSNNKITIGKSLLYQDFIVNFKGDNKTIDILPSSKGINGLKIVSIRGNNQVITIGENFSCGGLEIQMNDGSEKCIIGSNCLFSWGIKLRTSDGHSVIDLDSGEPINWPKDVSIGDRVWVGEDVKFLKGSIIANDSIVGSNAIVTKAFLESNCVVAGFPATVIKNNVKWDYEFPQKLKTKEEQLTGYEYKQFNPADYIFYLKQFDSIVQFPFNQLDKSFLGSNDFSKEYIQNDIFFVAFENGILVGNEFFATSSKKVFYNKKTLYLTSEKAVEKCLQENSIITSEPEYLYFVAANGGYKNFYHWMYQALPTIASAKQLFRGLNIKYIVPPLNEMRKKSLELLNINTNDILILNDNENIECKNLIYTNILSGDFSFNPSKYVIDMMKEFKENCLKAAKVTSCPSKIYLSRKDSNRRTIENESELTKALEKEGFQEVVFSEYNLEDQVAIMANAEFIVAPHGAGLVHLIYADKCRGLIEILPGNYFNQCFYKICQAKSIPYSNVVSKIVNESHKHHSKSNTDIKNLINLVHMLVRN